MIFTFSALNMHIIYILCIYKSFTIYTSAFERLTCGDSCLDCILHRVV